MNEWKGYEANVVDEMRASNNVLHVCETKQKGNNLCEISDSNVTFWTSIHESIHATQVMILILN